MSSKVIKNKEYIHDNDYYYSIISRNIRKYRKENNMTQQDLADMTDLSREYIYDIENENRNKHFQIYVVGRIAEALNVDIGILFEE